MDFDGEGDDDQAEFHAESEQSTHPAVQSRWPTRVCQRNIVKIPILWNTGNLSIGFFFLIWQSDRWVSLKQSIVQKKRY